jgi:hypothetical protein
VAVGSLAALFALYARILPPKEGERVKGGTALELIVRHASGATEVAYSGLAIHPQEAIRFKLSHPTAGYVAIVGIDSAGRVTPYFPETEHAAPIGAGTGQLLDGSVILDETLGPERLVAVDCRDPFPVRSAITEARAALEKAAYDPRRVGRLSLDCAQATSLIEKAPAE